MTRNRAGLVTPLLMGFLLAGCGGGSDGDGPALGESVELERAAGQVLIRQPDEETFATLEETTLVPVGTEVDASKGTVRMTSATEGGDTQTGEFSQGGFEVSQPAGSTEVTLSLRGGDFSECRTRAAQRDRSTVGGPEIRRLFVKADGDFRTKGRFAAAAIRGTEFTAVDACFGTLTAVRVGQVTVTDLTADKEIQLNPGEQYWAAERPG